MNKFILFFILILLLPTIIAECSDNQIDINSASKTDLNKLNGIGEVKAQAVIDSRPFDSVDDLIKVYGIGEITLNKIKAQGLACVEDEKTNETENKEEQNKTKTKPDNKNTTNIIKENTEITKNQEPKEIAIIKLSIPKDIKTNDNSSSLGKIAIYGLLLFCILLIILFAIKIFKRKDGIC